MRIVNCEIYNSYQRADNFEVSISQIVGSVYTRGNILTNLATLHYNIANYFAIQDRR